MSTDDLERGPFGRSLFLLLHRLPRTTAQFDWELDRGFHLEVISEDMFELNLRPRSASAAETLPLLEPSASGLDKILLWQRRPKDETGWEEFARHLKGKKPWQAALILSSTGERAAALTSFVGRRGYWKSVTCPVVQVFQPSPPATFFTVEKNLFMLGRLGRRLERYSGLRRWLPW